MINSRKYHNLSSHIYKLCIHTNPEIDSQYETAFQNAAIEHASSKDATAHTELLQLTCKIAMLIERLLHGIVYRKFLTPTHVLKTAAIIEGNIQVS